MAKNPKQKQKLILLLNLLMEETDENHSLTMADILESLEEEGVSAERKSIYDDLNTLKDLGYFVEYDNVKKGYYIADRDFQLVEVKMLSDTVEASRFLSQKKKRELIGKLGKLCSSYQAKQLHQTLHFTQGSFFENENVYYTLDTIYAAIEKNLSVSFYYFHYNAKKQKQYKRKDVYSVSPMALVWDNERYYLLAYDSVTKHERTFRLDLMEKCQAGEKITDEARAFKKAFNLDEFTGSTFGMYSGTVTEVKLKFSEDMIHTMLDRFGKEITIYPQEDESFAITVKVALSPQFFGWVVGLSPKVELVGPIQAVKALKQHLNTFLEEK